MRSFFQSLNIDSLYLQAINYLEVSLEICLSRLPSTDKEKLEALFKSTSEIGRMAKNSFSEREG